MDNRDLVLLMWASGIIRFGRFKWKLHERFPDLPKAPLKINFRLDKRAQPEQVEVFRKVTSKAGWWIGWQFYAKGSMEMPEYLAGVPNVGQTLAYSAFSGWPGREVQPPPKKLLNLTKQVNGRGRRITTKRGATYPRSDKVLLMDDVLSLGESKIEAAVALEAKGARPYAVAVLVEHDLGGRAVLEKRDLKVFSVMQMRDISAYLISEGLIDPETNDAYEKFCSAVRKHLE